MGGLGLPTDDKHSFVPEPVAAATVRDLLQLPEDTQSIRYEVRLLSSLRHRQCLIRCNG